MHIIYASDDASGDASPDASPDTSDGMMYRMISSKYFTTHDSTSDGMMHGSKSSQLLIQPTRASTVPHSQYCSHCFVSLNVSLCRNIVLFTTGYKNI